MRAGGFPGNPGGLVVSIVKTAGGRAPAHQARGRGRSTWRPTERSRRCSDGTAGRRQRSAGGWAARSRRVSEYRRSGGIEPTRPRGGKGAPAGGTVGGKDGQHTEVGSRLHVTTTDSRTGQTRRRDGGGHRLAFWTSGYATARSEAVCRGAGCGRTRTSGSVGGQGQQRPWSTRPRPIAGFGCPPRRRTRSAKSTPAAVHCRLRNPLPRCITLAPRPQPIGCLSQRAPSRRRHRYPAGHPIVAAPQQLRRWASSHPRVSPVPLGRRVFRELRRVPCSPVLRASAAGLALGVPGALGPRRRPTLSVVDASLRPSTTPGPDHPARRRRTAVLWRARYAGSAFRRFVRSPPAART